MDFILETLGRIGFEWRMGLFNLINFLIIFYILKKLFFGSITKTLNDRQEKIQEGIDNAKKAETELKMAESRAQEIIDKSKVEGNKIIDKASEEAKQVGERLRDKAKQEIDLLVKQAKKNIEIDQKEMRQALHLETVGIVIQAVEKLLGEKMDEKKDKEFVEGMLKNLK